MRLKEHVLGRWEAADKDPSLVDDGALNIVVVGGGPTGVESAGALAELYRGDFAKDYRNLPQDKARIILVDAGPEVFAMFKPDIRAYTKKALKKRSVEVMTGEAVESVSPTRVTLRSGTVLEAHTLVWGAGLQGNRLVQSLGLDLERGKPDRRRARTSPSRIIRRYTRSVTSPRSRMRRRNRSSPSSGRLRCSPESTPARRSPGALRARTPSRSSTATRGRWRRSVAERPSCRCWAEGR